MNVNVEHSVADDSEEESEAQRLDAPAQEALSPEQYKDAELRKQRSSQRSWQGTQRAERIIYE